MTESTKKTMTTERETRWRGPRDRDGHLTTAQLTSTVQSLRDEEDIRSLGYRFADACNRGDLETFADLWTDDAVWIIAEPMGVTARGLPQIEATIASLRPMWEYFVQMPHAPVVTIDGDIATSAWTVAEHARAKDGGEYHNAARYDDSLVRTRHGWRYAARTYTYYHLDRTEPADKPDTVDAMDTAI
jgi:uncharacterized protein (TIGR02246 family)